METEKNVEMKLSQQEVLDIVQLASNLYDAFSSEGVYTPQLLNRNLQDKNNNYLIPDKESLAKALAGYKDSQEVLQAFNEFAEVYDMLFKRLIDYYAGLLSFDLDFVCTNAYTKEDYNSEEYAEDEKIITEFFDKFDYKYEFGKILRQIIRKEVVFTTFRDSQYESKEIIPLSESSFTIQTLPDRYCMITGEWAEDKSRGLLFDFDMSYFDNAGVDINSYAPCYKNKRKSLEENFIGVYNPTSKLDARNGAFSEWVQTSPNDGNWVWKFNMDNINATPFLTPVIEQLLTNREVEKLQNNANLLASKGIIAGKIPLMDKQQAGQKQDAMSWQPKTLTKFMMLVKAGLMENVNAVALPTEENKFFQFENKNEDMLKKQMEISSGVGSSANSILYSTDKASQSLLEAQITADYDIVRRIYRQFESFLNFYVNRKTKKFKFKFLLDGSNYGFLRKIDKNNLLDLADRGIVLHSASYAKIVNMNPFDFKRALEESKFTNWVEKYSSQLKSIHTNTNKENSNKKESDELSDGGSANREYEYNLNNDL